MNKNIVKSIKYIEFYNDINKLINKILYSKEEGYINLLSKRAIENYQKTIDKFLYESSLLKEKSAINDSEKIIETKKNELILKLNEHKSKQLNIWLDEVFDDFIEQLFFELSINKTKKEEYYRDLISLINWYSNLKKITKKEYTDVIKKYSEEFNSVLEKKESDYIPEEKNIKTNGKVFVELWNKLSDNFSSMNLDSYTQNLSIEDLNYFKNIQARLKTNKITELLDEINLINSALTILNLKNNENKVDFIKEINNDFKNFFERNKKITDDDKISITKRRIELFKDKINNSSSYYRKKLSF